ncbi:COP1-interacting protein 7 isoform X2 [Ziziphus jujuba]|uniref:COP1-interacting protein 7 isoform X2 n=1 Tax=Ziziphus jujuba TaxID=326968 RepID=A0A6P4AH89_ZIZJJ|nr:COP1-interacting protein 7 isoform X2 [Ziziphus jujuba]
MKSLTQLDSAVFQLTPTRTRCDLVISANGKTEKLASGLLNPFLAHLKTAQEQMAKGGYSITLEPERGTDASWFTKGTVERFVRFVSTPEVLERVYNLESEILQIEEAISIQGNTDMGISTVEESQAKPVESIEGSRHLLDANEDKAIVLYQPGGNPPEANRSTAQEGNSKVQLLKVLETRKTVLQKEQGMAFARAVAAGFDIDNMSPLMSFSECFGASRLKDACIRFKDLWKKKHETGQWLEIEAAEAMSSRPDFSAMNASGIILSSVANESHTELASENNGKSSGVTSASEKSPMDNQPPLGHQEYFQGQFPHQMYPPWPMHSPPGMLPVYQPYPMQGMPYYKNYPGASPYFQPPYLPVEDPSVNPGQRIRQRRHSMDSSKSNIESETWDMDVPRTRSSDDAESEKETLQSRESQKKAGRSSKKQAGMVVIRNINYITSKGQDSSDTESQSASESQTDEEGEGLHVSSSERKHKNSLRSSKRNGNHSKSSGKEEMTFGEADGGHWQAFQNFLLKDADEDKHGVDEAMFAMEKKAQLKRRQNMGGDDPITFGGQDKGETQTGSVADIHNLSGKITRMQTTDESLISKGGHQLGDGGRTRDGELDLQYTEIDGRRVGYQRSTGDDFVIHRQENHSGFTSSPDHLAVNGFGRETNSTDRRASHNMDDDSYVVSLRSTSLYQTGNDYRNAIDMDSESAMQKAENLSNRVGSQVNYEPDELSLMPERGAERGATGYDPALDYEMQVQTKDGASLNKKNKEVVTDIKQGAKKSSKDLRSKPTPEKKNVGPIRKGKPSKLSPLDEARARADKLRTYKADLQKMKKEREEEEIKRLEALKMERQKRIAARGSSISAQSSQSSQLTRKQIPTKTPPSSHKGSKFSDSEPGSTSPLQRYPVRAASLGPNDLQKTKHSKLKTGSQSAGNRLSQSVSSLSEAKKENAGDTKASMARIRRLSEPKMNSSHHVSSVKQRSAESVSKTKVSDGPEIKKISAIVNYDRTKAATLPELKIRTSKGPDTVQSKSTAKETSQKGTGNKSSVTSEGGEPSKNGEKFSAHSDVDDNPIIEKTVVMLEREKPSIPVIHASEENSSIQKGKFDNLKTSDKTVTVSDYAAIRAPVSPLSMDTADEEPTEHQLPKQISSYKDARGDAGKEPPNSTSIGVAEKPYQAPYARVSSLEDPCTKNTEYGKAPPVNLESMATSSVSGKAHVFESRNLKLEKIPETLEKPQVKESSKGFRRLLKFGRKNHSSGAGEYNAESDNISINGSEADDNGIATAASDEVHTLKNLISRDETPTASATPQKPSRHFSLLSPFRSKNSDKKLPTA